MHDELLVSTPDATVHVREVSDADLVMVLLYDPDNARCTIEVADGRAGCCSSTTMASASSSTRPGGGIANMGERAYDLGGAFEIGSEPDGTGTSAT